MCTSKGGFTRHTNSAHPTTKNVKINSVEKAQLDMTIFLKLLEEVQATLAVNDCYPQEKCKIIKEYKLEFVQLDQLYKTVLHLYEEINKTNDPDMFLSKFYASIMLYSNTFFLNLEKELSALIVMNLAKKVLHFYKNPQNTSVEEDQIKSISTEELDGLQYLAGYVIHKFMKKKQKIKIIMTP